MANPLAKDWEYMVFSFDKKIKDNADPKVQIAQTAEAERQRHQEIQRQAAAIIGNRNQPEVQLRRLISERDKITGNTHQALANADQARAEDDEATIQKMEGTAEVFVTQLMNVEKELENVIQLHQQTVSAAEEAQRQAQQSRARYEQVKQDIRMLESQADRARMQETTSKTLQGMQGISEGPNVPTLDLAHEKIEGRYASVLGARELTGSSQTGRMVEVETPTRNAVADMCLAEVCTQMSNESVTLESSSVAKGNAGGLESAGPARSIEAIEDTTTDTDEAK